METQKLPTLEDLEAKLEGLEAKRILVRSDLNVPITDGLIDDDLRIQGSLNTLKWLEERKASVVVCSHLGRPADQKDNRYSIQPVKAKLLELSLIHI